MKHINMETFANGAFTEQINRELKKVTENIQDPNTDATAKRKITVMIEFKPNETRNFVTTGVQAKATLAKLSVLVVCQMSLWDMLGRSPGRSESIQQSVPG